MKTILLAATALALMTAGDAARAGDANPPAKELKLYTLNCGEIHVSDLNVFSDTDRYIGQEKDLTVGCYLIRHGEDWLLWDTGLPGEIAAAPKDERKGDSGPFHPRLEKTIVQQLDVLGLKPEDITHVGISHGHFDHTGNVNLFKNATLVIQEAEYDLMKNSRKEAEAMHMTPATMGHFLQNPGKARLLKGDADIFGDGTVKAISLPGHTPGHMALLVDLPKSGPVILSGDQWHFRENRKDNGVPSFNDNRADTLASSDKLNRLIKNRGARLIIQHEASDNADLPKLPGALE